MKGEVAALSAALMWAVASILFAAAGRRVVAINLNFIKGAVAAGMMLLLLTCGSIFGHHHLNLHSLFTLSTSETAVLCLSGFIGIGAGDTAYFACLRRIGPQKGLMLGSTAPILAALQAFVLFREMLTLPAWCGILITCSGVILVIRCSRAPVDYRTTLAGVLFGLLAAFCQAGGVVLSRKVFLEGDVEPLTTALVRITAALFIMGCWMLIRRMPRYRSQPHQSLTQACTNLYKHRMALKLFIAIFVGTFLAIWLMQASVKHTSAGITQTLLATSPLFGMLFGRLQGQRQPFMVWLGLALGITGISLLFLQ